MSRRGDVVIVEIPFTDTAGSKPRPAIVVLNDKDNRRLRKTVGEPITGNLKRLTDPSHLLIDPTTPDGATSGIHHRSLVTCNNLFTIEQDAILQTVGHLSEALKLKLNDCLKAALEIF